MGVDWMKISLNVLLVSLNFVLCCHGTEPEQIAKEFNLPADEDELFGLPENPRQNEAASRNRQASRKSILGGDYPSDKWAALEHEAIKQHPSLQHMVHLEDPAQIGLFLQHQQQLHELLLLQQQDIDNQIAQQRNGQSPEQMGSILHHQQYLQQQLQQQQQEIGNLIAQRRYDNSGGIITNSSVIPSPDQMTLLLQNQQQLEQQLEEQQQHVNNLLAQHFRNVLSSARSGVSISKTTDQMTLYLQLLQQQIEQQEQFINDMKAQKHGYVQSRQMTFFLQHDQNLQQQIYQQWQRLTNLTTHSFDQSRQSPKLFLNLQQQLLQLIQKRQQNIVHYLDTEMKNEPLNAPTSKRWDDENNSYSPEKNVLLNPTVESPYNLFSESSSINRFTSSNQSLNAANKEGRTIKHEPLKWDKLNFGGIHELLQNYSDQKEKENNPFGENVSMDDGNSSDNSHRNDEFKDGSSSGSEFDQAVAKSPNIDNPSWARVVGQGLTQAHQQHPEQPVGSPSSTTSYMDALKDGNSGAPLTPSQKANSPSSTTNYMDALKKGNPAVAPMIPSQKAKPKNNQNDQQSRGNAKNPSGIVIGIGQSKPIEIPKPATRHGFSPPKGTADRSRPRKSPPHGSPSQASLGDSFVKKVNGKVSKDVAHTNTNPYEILNAANEDADNEESGDSAVQPTFPASSSTLASNSKKGREKKKTKESSEQFNKDVDAIVNSIQKSERNRAERIKIPEDDKKKMNIKKGSEGNNREKTIKSHDEEKILPENIQVLKERIKSSVDRIKQMEAEHTKYIESKDKNKIKVIYLIIMTLLSNFVKDYEKEYNSQIGQRDNDSFGEILTWMGKVCEKEGIPMDADNLKGIMKSSLHLLQEDNGGEKDVTGFGELEKAIAVVMAEADKCEEQVKIGGGYKDPKNREALKKVRELYLKELNPQFINVFGFVFIGMRKNNDEELPRNKIENGLYVLIDVSNPNPKYKKRLEDADEAINKLYTFWDNESEREVVENLTEYLAKMMNAVNYDPGNDETFDKLAEKIDYRIDNEALVAIKTLKNWEQPLLAAVFEEEKKSSSQTGTSAIPVRANKGDKKKLSGKKDDADDYGPLDESNWKEVLGEAEKLIHTVNILKGIEDAWNKPDKPFAKEVYMRVWTVLSRDELLPMLDKWEAKYYLGKKILNTEKQDVFYRTIINFYSKGVGNFTNKLESGKGKKNPQGNGTNERFTVPIRNDASFATHADVDESCGGNEAGCEIAL